jgi:Mn2+/Fe2+ NRAMP family transporter
MQALYYAAVVNGVIAVPLIFIIIRMADDSRIVDRFKTQTKYKIVAWMTFVFMAMAVVMMVASVFVK